MKDHDRRTRLQRKLNSISRSTFWRSWGWKGTLGLTVVMIALLVRFVADISVDRAANSRFQIIRIIDGDTVELTGGERLRLLFIDTPERGEPYYDSASALVATLALNKFGDLHFGKRKRDGYGRLLATLFVDSINVNRELLRRGFANLYLFPDNLNDTIAKKQVSALLAAQQEALRGNRGLWSLERTEEKNYLTSTRSLRFHRPSCRLIHNLAISKARVFESRLLPLTQGLSPCRVCRP